MEKKIKIIDSTLRDGNHTVKNKFSLEDIKTIVKLLNEVKIDYIEVGYGYGLGSFNEENYPSDLEIISTAINNSDFSKIAILVFPNKIELESYEEILDLDIGLIRIAVQSEDVTPAKDYIKLALKKGFKVGGFMMMAHKVSNEKLISQGKILKDFGVESITLTDSSGAMIPDEVEYKINLLAKITDLKIGFHTHDNLGLASGNSYLAIKNGAEYIDTSLGGLGAGAGNTKTECMISILSKSKYKINGDLFIALDSVNKLKEIVKKYSIDLNSSEKYILTGYSGIYSTFIDKIIETTNKYDIDQRELLLKVGKANIIPGEENKIDGLARSIKSKKIKKLP